MSANGEATPGCQSKNDLTAFPEANIPMRDAAEWSKKLSSLPVYSKKSNSEFFTDNF
jgi:hypothetical protein